MYYLSLSSSSVCVFSSQRTLKESGGRLRHSHSLQASRDHVLWQFCKGCSEHTEDLEDRLLNKAVQRVNSLHSKSGLVWVLHQRKGGGSLPISSSLWNHKITSFQDGSILTVPTNTTVQLCHTFTNHFRFPGKLIIT